MSKVEKDLRYAKTHEWAMKEGDGTVRVGVSDYAQSQLGDVVFVELPKKGAKVKAGATLGLIESVKSVSDLYSPVSGEVVEANERLKKEPQLVNKEPYGNGWFIRVKPAEPSGLDALLDAGGYEKFIEAARKS